MLDKSRCNIYDYLYGLFYGTLTENVYIIGEPQELEESDRNDGFLVIRVGEINDDSEFDSEAYGWARCFVEAYIPTVTRGRVDVDKFKEFEDGIESVISLAIDSTTDDDTYYIENSSVISSDAEEVSNANNTFFVFIKSFVVVIDKQSE